MNLKDNLKLIEIELFSYCNRKCWMCPNSFIDRKTNNTFMKTEIYKKILKELGSIDYDNLISFSRYNEPLSKKII